MAKYKASQTIHCWKQHRCAGCNALYRYLFKRQSAITASSPEKAQALLRKTVDKVAATSLDERPCPSCGAFQPDMLAQHRRTRYFRYGWVAGTVLLIAAFVSAAHGLNIPTMALLTVVTAGLFIALEARAALRNFNGDLIGNRANAEAAVSKGELRLDAPGVGGQPQFDLGGRRPGPALVAMLAVCVLVLPLAEAARLALKWPLNTNFYPPVVSPGDETQFYMPESITSVKGYWRGTPSAEVTNAEELGLATGVMPASARENSWSGTISVKSSEQNSHVTPWIKFTLPGEASLANKVAKLRLKLAAEFPQMFGTNTYRTLQKDFAAESDLRLADPGAGMMYQELWYGSLAGSIVLLALATFLLRRQAQNESRNTQTGLLPLDQAAAPPPIPGGR